MAQVTYNDKSNFKIEASIPNEQKVRASDMNELKNVINQNEGNALSEVATDSTLTGDGKALTPLSVDASGIPAKTLQEVTEQGNTTDQIVRVRALELPIATPAYQPGTMWFDGVNVNIYDNIAGTSIQVGKELVVDVVNNNGVTINNLEAVRYDTAILGAPSVVRAQADTTANASGIAVMTQDLLVGETGKAVAEGLASGDTSSLVEGGRVFLSATVPGGLTSVEQPILSFVGYCLVSDPINGVLLVSPSGVANITAIGQSTGEGTTQSLTTTPQSITAYLNNAFELNTTITHTGATNLTTAISPVSIGASGYYRVGFNVALATGSNALYTFEVYVNGSPTGVLCVADLRNNNVDAGSGSINAVSQSIILDTDSLEIYGYADGGTNAVTYTSATFNIERIGNI